LVEVSPPMNAFEYVGILKNVSLNIRGIYVDDMPTIQLIQDNSVIYTFHIV
ncbi:hypothetical protein EAI_02104, partial [Harpegnathos saltator]